MMTTEEDKANNIKDDDSTNTNANNAADNDNDDEEHQQQKQNKQNKQQKQQLLLFESLLIKRIVKFLNYKPDDFAITLLPPPSQSSLPLLSCDDEKDEDDDNNNSLLLLLTPEYRILLETSIMLIREEEEEEEEEEEDVVNENDNNNDTPKATATTTTATTKAKYHLGLEAQNLPLVARTLRKVYHTTKMKMKKAKAMKLQEGIINTNNNNNKNKNKKEEVEVEVEEEIETKKTATLNSLLFNITSCLLLIQPDHSTVWSDRRRCLLLFKKEENEILLLMWYNELDYLDLLMTQHSKAPSSWAHRKYVLHQLLSLHNKHHQQEVQDLVMKEVNGICSSVAEKYPKNYYAWTHRIYVVSELLLLPTMFIKKINTNNIDISICNISTKISKFLETELEEKMYNEWLPKHPTDHSAIHYTCQILDYLLDILNQKEYYLRLCFMEMYDDDDDDDGYEEEWHNQQLKNLHTEVVKKKYDLSILALKQVQILLSKYYQSSNSNSNSNSNRNESLWILRRMTCQIIWKHSSSSSHIVIKHHEYDNKNESLRMLMMRQLVRNDIKSVIDSLNIIPTRISSSLFDKEEKDLSLSLSLTQLVDAGNANGDDEKMDAISTNKNNIHAWTFLAWCIVNISSTTTSTITTLFTLDIREAVMRRLQGAEATATTTTTATAANNDGSTADATAPAATTTTTAQHNTRLWTSSSSPNILLV